MSVLRSVVALAVMVGVATAQEFPSPRRGYESTSMEGERVEVTFSRWREAILVENVMVNGRGPYRFLLDTGAEGAGRIDDALVSELGLEDGGATETVGLLGQRTAMTQRRLEEVSIGGLRFTNVEMTSRDYNAELMAPGLPEIHGILGFHLFNEYLLTIDYPGRSVVIERGELPEADGGSVLRIVSDDEDPEVEILVGGVRVPALLDTGAMGRFGVPSEVATGLRFSGEPVVRGRDGDAVIRTATLDGSIFVGEVEFATPELFIVDGLTQAVVGVHSLASLRVTFDQKNGRVRVERPADRARYGLALSWRGQGPWELQGVDEGGIAERAGLREGDRIVAMNGERIGDVDREDGLDALDGPTLTVVVERDGREIELKMSLP